MSNGMQMMLKAFGLDPDLILKSVEDIRGIAIECGQALKDNTERLRRIEALLIDNGIDKARDHDNGRSAADEHTASNGQGHASDA